MKFNDGMQLDTSGELRVTRRYDGYYVVGKGLLIPVGNRKEGQEMIAELKTKEAAK